MTKPIDLTVDTAGATRMAFLMTHYRQPVEMGDAKIAEAMRILRRFALACEPTLDGPPLEEAANVADEWYHNIGHGSPGDEIRALKG